MKLTKTWQKITEHENSITYAREVDGLYQSLELEKSLVEEIQNDLPRKTRENK